jgi:hypothetical protein
MNKKNWLSETTLICLFILVNLILKLFFINVVPIDGDEPFTLFFSQVSYSELWEMMQTENNPPLHFIITSVWTKLFGISPVIARIPALLFHVATIYYLFKIGSSFFHKSVGVIACVLFTFSTYHGLFSHEVRVYSLFTLLTAASMYYFMLAVTSTPNKRVGLKLICCNVLLIYSHFLGHWVLMVQLGILFFTNIHHIKDFFKNYLWIYLVTLIAYIPYAIVFVKRVQYTTSQGTWVEAPKGISSLYFALWQFLNSPLVTVIFLCVFAAYVILYFFNKIVPYRNIYRSIVMIWAWIPFLAMFIISFWIPMFIGRYLAFVSIAFYLLFAVMLYQLTKLVDKRAGNLLVVLILLVFSLGFNPYTEADKRKADEYVNHVKRIKQQNPDAVVIISPKWAYRTFAYHYDQNYFKDYKQTLQHLQAENIFPVFELKELGEEINNYRKIIFIDNWASLTDSEETVKQYLMDFSSSQVKTELFGNVSVYSVGL